MTNSSFGGTLDRKVALRVQTGLMRSSRVSDFAGLVLLGELIEFAALYIHRTKRSAHRVLNFLWRGPQAPA
jgi:hypothetical protein